MKNIYPVITLYQPWATWIMREWKTIETRTHTKFHSLLNRTVLIHSGQKTDDAAKNCPYLTHEQIKENPDEMINGYILGSVYVYDCMYLSPIDAKYALIECDTERYGLFLNNINKFPEPIREKGEMGIWYYDLENKCKVRKPDNRLLLAL